MGNRNSTQDTGPPRPLPAAADLIFQVVPETPTKHLLKCKFFLQLEQVIKSPEFPIGGKRHIPLTYTDPSYKLYRVRDKKIGEKLILCKWINI